MLVSEEIKLLYPLQNKQEVRVGVVYTQWNARLVEMLYYDAIKTLQEYGIMEQNIYSVQVPGAVEITYAAKKLAEKKRTELSGILTLACVIRGDTPHFDYVAMSVTQGITQLNIQLDIPVVMGILTSHNYQQALERSTIKGREFAITLLNMMALSQKI